MSTRKNKSIRECEKIRGQELTFGRMIRSIRISDEYTQTELSEILGISKQYISDIENERRLVSPKLASEYAKCLGYSEKQFVKLAIQDQLRRSGLDFQVNLDAA